MSRIDALALLLLLSGSAAAAGDDLFARFDGDGNGVLSAAELSEARGASASWIAVDRDRDGVTRDEFTSLAYAEAPGVSVGLTGSASAGATVVELPAEHPAPAPQPNVNVIVVNTLPWGVLPPRFP